MATQIVNGMPATNGAPLAHESLFALYAPVADDLAAVEEILRGELRSPYPFVDELVRYGFRLGGKRLRPALLLLSAQALGGVTQEHRVLAAVVEMVHTATLIHDDVLDEAQVRRHMATVNSRWNNEASVLLGDYLFTHAFYLASTLDTTFACRAIGRATNVVCEGELRQVHARGNYDLTEGEYYEIIQAKTAELCACCCLLGAHYAGAESETVERLAAYGRNLGIAFQIADDLLDLEGDETTVGKSLGTDLEKEKPTLPLIHALAQLSAGERTVLITALEAGDRPRGELLHPYWQKYRSIDYAREKAQSFAAAARAQLEGLGDNSAMEILRGLTEFVVRRRR